MVRQTVIVDYNWFYGILM